MLTLKYSIGKYILLPALVEFGGLLRENNFKATVDIINLKDMKSCKQ